MIFWVLLFLLLIPAYFLSKYPNITLLAITFIVVAYLILRERKKRQLEEQKATKQAELEQAAEQKRLDDERAARERAERIRQEIEARQREKARKSREYAEMVAQIKSYKINISPDLAPIILAKNQTPVTYSTITKRTPRDKLGNFVVVDTETTGLWPASCEIIDIAAIRFRNYKPVEKFTTLLSSKKPIPKEITSINGITDKMVAGCPLFQQVAQSLVDFIGDDNLVGHNLPFDLSFIVRYGADVTLKKRKYYDTLEISRKTVKQLRKKWDKELESYEIDYDSDGIENYKLVTLCQWYGISNPDAHRAESDALATGFLFKALADDRQ